MLSLLTRSLLFTADLYCNTHVSASLGIWNDEHRCLSLQEVPTSCFALRTQLLVRNLTEQPFELHCEAGRLIAVPPMTVVAADWRPSLERPDFVSILMYTSSFKEPQAWITLTHA